MAHLKLSGVSADRRLLLLFDEAGESHTVEISPALRRAVEQSLRTTGTRGDTPSRTEPTMSSTLRPRDIQDRIRSGETPETVATAAGTTVEAIMPFVAPVLAEREHVALRAQRSSVRRTAGDGGTPGARVLEDAVAAQLRSNDTRPDTVTWDSYRREDGRWTLTAGYETRARTGTAHFTFDAPGNYVTADDDDARWLVGDLRAEAAVPAPADDLQQARQRRLAAVAEEAEELPFADDALDLVGSDATRDTASDTNPNTARDTAPDAAPPAEETPAARRPEHPAAEAEEPAEAPARRSVQKKRGRASVPSWDEIMFGGSSEG